MSAMRLPSGMPHPHLVVLRSLATLALSAVVAQAGWAAAFLGGQGQYLGYHRVGAWVTTAVVVGTAVGYLVLRRSAGPVNVALALVLAVAVVVQVTLGRGGAVSAHVFLGVLIAMVATALTSWTYRHVLPSSEGGADSTSPRSQ
ncbi:hypothetical protein [Serinicoccus hydrothermalis]|uniref:hypothetical protein n=1 Tax=Serinicoccus hydrothermalis TaxID=1758689 RepID=UPI0012F78A7B|nr:hypothetical protein [Serinicoccus hydrothermalis]